jgi:two-component system sensor histidine kinase DegS
MTSPAELAEQLAAELAALDAEVKEIDLLVSQARSEFARHETRRASAADKLAAMGTSTTAREAIDLANQTVTLTRRASLMDAQVEIMEAKKKALQRLKDAIDDNVQRVRDLEAGPEGGDEAEYGADESQRDAAADDADAGGGGRRGGGGGKGKASKAAIDVPADPAVARIILTAQEDLRREISRAMHDGPAQSLTNIVLQAEIVERLVGVDPTAAQVEVRQLVGMVQHTLEATKTFIFDVRPMVLDDLGLVPTLRRAARDRGRRAEIQVDFESLGQEQRLSAELESGLFRILDEGLAGYVAARPERVSLRLDWSEALTAELFAQRTAPVVPPLDLPVVGEKVPPALAAMMEQRRKDHAKAAEAAARLAVVQLPGHLSRDLAGRAASLGISAEVLDDGSRLRLVAPVSDEAHDAAAPGGTGSRS